MRAAVGTSIGKVDMFKPTQHKIAKNEKLDQVVRKYGHKDWKLIWKDKGNSALVSKRKTPENLQPGDMVNIPPNEKQIKEELAYIAQLQTSIVAEMAAEKYFTGFAKQFSMLAQQNNNAVDSVAKDYKKIIGKVQDVRSKASRTKEGVDVTADMALMMLGLAKIAQAGVKSAVASGDELLKINNQAMAEAIALTTAPVGKLTVDAGNKYLTDAKAGRSTGALLVGELSTAFNNLTKPSFWGTTAAKLIDGADWSTAVTADLDADLKKVISKMEADRDKIISNYKAQGKALTVRAAEMERAAKQSQKFIKDLKAELKQRE